VSFYVSTATFFWLHCDEWDRVVALPRHVNNYYWMKNATHTDFHCLCIHFMSYFRYLIVHFMRQGSYTFKVFVVPLIWRVYNFQINGYLKLSEVSEIRRGLMTVDFSFNNNYLHFKRNILWNAMFLTSYLNKKIKKSYLHLSQLLLYFVLNIVEPLHVF
jgi:hypothetical protein